MSMTKREITIAFPDVSPDVANQLAESLAKELRREVRDEEKTVDPKVVRTDPQAQDFGTTIVLILGAPAIVVLAKAIRDWAQRTHHSTIKLNGVRITNVKSEDVAEIITALNASYHPDRAW